MSKSDNERKRNIAANCRVQIDQVTLHQAPAASQDEAGQYEFETMAYEMQLKGVMA